MKSALLQTVLFLVFAAVSRLAEAIPLQALQYRYGEARIFLTVECEAAGTLFVEHSPVNNRGRKAGRTKREKFEVAEGQTEVVLTPSAGVGHRLTLKMNKHTVALFTNRGTWYLKGEGYQNAENPRKTDVIDLQTGEDLLLATGFSVNMGRSDTTGPISVGRTMGPDEGFGVAVGKRDRVLVIRAKGTIGPVIISVTERLDSMTTQYYDYPLLLNDTMRRYEVPLAELSPRGQTKGRLRAIHAVSLRSVNAATAGDKLVFDYLALSRGGPYIQSISRTGNKGAIVQIANLGAGRRATLFYKDKIGQTTHLPAVRGRNTVPSDAISTWLCAERIENICDPPDAPKTSYGIPVPKGKDMIVDNFDTPLPVNRFRLPSAVFAATPELERQLTKERLNGTLRLTYYPDSEADYAGFLTLLPDGIGATYRTLSITLRGSLPPNFLQAGVKDQQGREARIPMISYWSGDETAANPLFDIKDMNPNQAVDSEGFRTVRFPIDAFRAVFYNVFEGHARLKDISGISLTMSFGGANIFHEIEVRDVSLTNRQIPIVITAFDNERYGINSLGGVNFSEDNNADLFDVRFNADGFYGKGLRAEISLPAENAYGLVAFGFGNLDAAAYETLSFSVRGEHGGENADIYLNDGNCRAKIELSEFTRVSKMWRTAKIPLERFKSAGVNLSRLTQLILAWEDEYISHQVIYFDNFVFE